MEIKERMAAWRDKMRSRGGGLRSLRDNRRGAMDSEDIGFAIAVAGGFVAIATLVGIFFVPVATFTVFDQQLGAFFGALLLVLGIGIAAASR